MCDLLMTVVMRKRQEGEIVCFVDKNHHLDHKLIVLKNNNNNNKMIYVQLTSSPKIWATTALVETAPAPELLSIWRRCSSSSSSPLFFRYLQNYFTIYELLIIFICRTLSNPRCFTGSLAFASYGITSSPTILTKYLKSVPASVV